jgi:histidinol-phosphatase (PHP family)
MIIADFHTHSHYSSDSDASMESMVERAIELGLSKLCFTDHMDFDYPPTSTLKFLFDPEEYFKELEYICEKYKNKIEVLKGIEIGLQSHIGEEIKKLVSQYRFDFIIGSSHLAIKKDPYMPDYWENKSIEQGIREYFESIVHNVAVFPDFQVYGHIDYIIRYIPDKNYVYSYQKFSDYIEEALKAILNAGRGIEVNTSGYKYGLRQPHPGAEVLKRYKELGGELITIGSDGHKPEHLAYDFKIAEQLLISLGFKYYTTFKDQKPEFHKLG